MIKKIVALSLLFCGLSVPALWGQEDSKHPAPHHLVHESHLLHLGKGGHNSEAYWDSLHQIRHPSRTQATQAATLPSNVVVLGWHPHFMGTAYQSYDFDLLSMISYFSYKLEPATGDYQTIYNWKTTGLHQKAAGKSKVLLTVTNFGSSANQTFLENSKAQAKLIQNLITLVSEKKAHGVTLDFEIVPGSMRTAFTQFVQKMRAEFSKNPSSKDFLITMSLPSVDFNAAFDVRTLSEVVDLFVVMGYDYYYQNSPNAGPSAPLASGDLWKQYNLEKSVESYLEKGIPSGKLLLGLPYYGDKWATYDQQLNSKTMKGSGHSVTYKQLRETYPSAYEKGKEEANSKSFYHIWSSGSDYQQLWFDNEVSLGRKYDLVKEKNLAGIGIWALGYDNGYFELWDLLAEKFGTGTTSDTGQVFRPVDSTSAVLPPKTDSTATAVLDQVKAKLGAIFNENTKVILILVFGLLLLVCFLALLVALVFEKLRNLLFKTRGRQVAFLIVTLVIGTVLFVLLQSASMLLIALVLGIGLGLGLATINQITFGHLRKNLP